MVPARPDGTDHRIAGSYRVGSAAVRRPDHFGRPTHRRDQHLASWLEAWLKIQVGHGLRLVGLVETSFREALRVRDETMSSDPDVQRAHQELANAEIAEQAAASTLKNAQAELQRLQAELQELRPERRLFRLIEERSRTAAYSQHLGIISLIRTDFEQMSKLLVDMIDEERDLAEGRPPIQRIVLYIDDLDRCRPERVVEVLEAVHLLLAFPLFIVVVGVDPRWLRHSLAQHYTATLSEEDVPARLAGRGGSAFYSTPQEYLREDLSDSVCAATGGENRI